MKDHDGPNKCLVTTTGPAGDSVPGEVQATTLLVGYHNYFSLMALVILSPMLPALLVPAASRHAER